VTGIQGRRRKQQRGNLTNGLMRCIVDMVGDNARGWQHSPEACSVCVCVCVCVYYVNVHRYTHSVTKQILVLKRGSGIVLKK
jgi:hypothetical protein